jgi:hypothetical protein
MDGPTVPVCMRERTGIFFMQITFDPEQAIGRINELTKVQLPRASYRALNKALFETRVKLQSEAKQTFKSIVPFTKNSFLYKKPVQVGDTLEATVFVRNDAPGGNAPSRYLDPHIRGGRAYETRFQRSLTNTVVQQIDGRSVQARPRARLLRPTASDQVRPNRQKNNSYPTMSQGQYNQILSALKGGKSSADYQETGAVPFSIGRRYTYLDEEALEHPYFKNRFTSYARKPGVYKIMRQNKQPRFYRVLTEGRIPTYKAKFKFFDIAKDSVQSVFAAELRKNILM